jgi:reverse transcriptase-like protein
VKSLLLSEGFKPLISDSAVFYNPKLGIFIVTYVDDCLIIGKSLKDINSLKKRLAKVYALEDIGPASLFLGVQITRNRKKGLLWLSQSHYIEEALRAFGLESCRPISIPLQPGVIGTKATRIVVSKADYKLYQSLVGTVIYLILQTRPDISYPIQWLSCYYSGPSKAHLLAAKNLLRYLNTYKDLRQEYTSKGSKEPIGYCDSDFAGDKDTSLCTYGYLFKVAGGCVSWKSKKGTTICLSTLESEFYALTEALREAEWLRNLYTEIGLHIKGPTPVMGDNQGANKSAYDPVLHARTKHTLLKFHYTREKVEAGVIKVDYLDTRNMPADGFTKALPPQKFRRFLGLLGLLPLENGLL